jgi:outer membrane biosynthesis protein TonB
MDLAGILLIAGFQIRTPLYPVTDVPSVTAQTITIASSALAFFFIAIALSMHGYSLFNPEENETVTAPTALMAAKKVPEEKKEAAEEKKPEIQKEPKAEPLKAAEPEAAEKPAPAKTEAKKSETKGGIDVEKLKALQEKLKK